jgi:hypothetical protein
MNEVYTGLYTEDLNSRPSRRTSAIYCSEAENTDSDAYRDLLREIDRAFQSFDHMAVRHGWPSGGDVGDAGPVETLDDAVDLPGFVASVLSREGDGYRVPPEWIRDISGLPGCDTGTVYLTADSTAVRDPQGHVLVYPGRSHPLTRRAIASVRTGRVSAASGHALSLLVTYTAEAGQGLRKVFALRLFPDGSVVEQPNFLSLAEQAAEGDALWPRLFADWAPAALAVGAAEAAKIADRIGSAFAAAVRVRIERDAITARAWLMRRCEQLCGIAASRTGDLFDRALNSRDWRSCVVPERRLEGFASDPSVAVPQRRDATEVLARFRTITAGRPPAAPPTARMLGILMLVP